MRILLAPDSGAAVAAPPAPAPAPAAQPSAPQAPKETDDFSTVDTMAKAAKPKPTPSPTAEPKKPDAAVDPNKPDPNKPAANGNEPAFDDPDDKKFSTPRQLREARKAALAKLSEANNKIREYDKKIADREKQGGDSTALSKRLETVEKEKAELQASLRAAKMEVSDDFKAKYEKPLDKAVANAAKRIGELQIVNELGEPVGRGDWAKFSRIYGMERPDAKKEARTLFADDASIVMDYYDQIHRMTDEKNEALSEEKANWKTRQDKEAADAEAAKALEGERREQWQTETKKAFSDIADQNPEWFQDGKDADENSLRAAAHAILENWVQGKNKEGQPLTAAQIARAEAMIRHRAANHPVMVYRLNRAQERIAELEAALGEKNGSAPGSTARPESGGEPASKDSDWHADLRKSVPEVAGG